MSNKLIPVAFVGAFALATSIFASAQAAVTGAVSSKMAVSAGDTLVLAKNVKGGAGGSKGGGPKTGNMGKPGSKGSMGKISSKGGPKGGPKVVKGGSKGNVRWSRDRRHRYYGGFFAVPFGFALYAGNPCYDWRLGPSGWGYYWNYRRCPL